MAFYSCDSCGFNFERLSAVTECPSCGKTNIREATAGEQAAVMRYLSEALSDDGTTSA